MFNLTSVIVNSIPHTWDCSSSSLAAACQWQCPGAPSRAPPSPGRSSWRVCPAWWSPCPGCPWCASGTLSATPGTVSWRTLCPPKRTTLPGRRSWRSCTCCWTRNLNHWAVRTTSINNFVCTCDYFHHLNLLLDGELVDTSEVLQSRTGAHDCTPRVHPWLLDDWNSWHIRVGRWGLCWCRSTCRWWLCRRLCRRQARSRRRNLLWAWALGRRRSWGPWVTRAWQLGYHTLVELAYTSSSERHF